MSFALLFLSFCACEFSLNQPNWMHVSVPLFPVYMYIAQSEIAYCSSETTDPSHETEKRTTT
jgi:hypothetical protein